MKKRNVILIIAAAWSFMIRAQESCSFEMRYFTHDAKANGVTDFHGETEWLSTEQRVALLDLYANYASRRWGDPNLNTPLFTEKEVEKIDQFLDRILLNLEQSERSSKSAKEE